MVGGVPAGVATKDCVASATVGDWRGDEVGKSLRQVTSTGGSNGVVAYRSASTSSGSIIIALAFSISIAIGVGELSWSSSVLARAELEMCEKLSVRSIAEVWWTELVMEDERVDGTRDGVALRDALVRVELRSLTLRDSEGNLLSSLPAMLCADASSDLRRLANRNSVSWVLKYSFSGS